MDYEQIFEDRIEQLHREGRYRVFADIKRRCGAYPERGAFPQGRAVGRGRYAAGDGVVLERLSRHEPAPQSARRHA